MHERPISAGELEAGPLPDVEMLKQPSPWCWRMDPELAAWCHINYPDDCQVLIHNGASPTFGDTDREIVWATINDRQGDIFSATVINDPQHVQSIRQGHTIQFAKTGGNHPPALLTGELVRDLPRLDVKPCQKCRNRLVFDSIAKLAPDEVEAYPHKVETVCRFCGEPQIVRIQAPIEACVADAIVAPASQELPAVGEGEIPLVDLHEATDTEENATTDEEDQGTGDIPPKRAGPPLRPRYPTDVNSTGAAWAALVLGIAGFLAAFLIPWLYIGQFVPIAAVIVAFMGLIFGVWGIYSRRRDVAITGSLLCLLLLMAGGFFLIVDFYVFTYGHTPWTAPIVDEFPAEGL